MEAALTDMLITAQNHFTESLENKVLIDRVVEKKRKKNLENVIQKNNFTELKVVKVDDSKQGGILIGKGTGTLRRSLRRLKPVDIVVLFT